MDVDGLDSFSAKGVAIIVYTAAYNGGERVGPFELGEAGDSIENLHPSDRKSPLFFQAFHEHTQVDDS